jgi:hypothetical protein
MTRGRWLLLALTLTAAPLRAAGPLDRAFSFDEKSRDALVIVEVVPQAVVEEWQIPLKQYSLEEKAFVGSVFKPISLLQFVEAQRESPRYFAGIVKPAGTHVLYGLITQRFWGACFDQGARAFTFEPGKVYYLGVVDPNESLVRIARELPKQSQVPLWVEGMRLPYKAPSQRAGWERDVSAFLAEALPRVKAPLNAAEGIEVSFTLSKSSAGNLICPGRERK